MADALRRRDRLRLAGLGGQTIVVLAAIVLAIAVADRVGADLDLSPDRRYTLDPDLLRIIAAQEAPVELVAIWSDEQTGNALRSLSEGLELIAATNTNLSLRRIDPVLHQPLYQAHRERYGDGGHPAIYLTRAERAFKIPVNAGTRRVLQREIGGGLLALAEPDPPTARFLSGHGELAPTGGVDGCDALLRAFELAGFRNELARDGAIPPGHLVVLAGPTGPLGSTTIDALDQHLIDGGALLAFVDDRMPADLAVLLRRWGILTGPGMPADLLRGDPSALFAENPVGAEPMVVVSRTRHAVLQEAEFPYANLLVDASMMANHPAVQAVAQSNRLVLSPWTTPVWQLDFDPQRDGELLERLNEAGRLPPFAEPPVTLAVGVPGDVWTTPRAEPPRVPADLAQRGPIPLAVAATYRPDPRSARQGEQPRIIVWGSRAAVANGVLAREQFANADLAVDCARWLVNRGRANPIPASESAAFTISATDGGLTLITALLVAVLPCLAIGGALLAWLHRR